MRRIVATCTMGNIAYERGDMLLANIEFIHAFASEDTIRSELEEGGLSVMRIETSNSSPRGGAVCTKNS